MMTALQEVPRNALSLFEIPGCEFTEVGLTIERGMAFEHWERLVRSLERAEQGIQWYLGDALNYGEAEYGEKFSQVIDAHKQTGIPVDTLRDYQRVACQVKPDVRTSTLSWSVHREVASLKPAKQRIVLAKAAAAKLTKRETSKEVHRIKRAEGLEKTEIEVLQTPEVKEWLDNLHAELKAHEPTVPTSAPFLRNMMHAMLGMVMWQQERTVEGDCDAIMEIFDSEGLYSATDSEIFQWLNSHGYFMRDPELDERLDLLCEQKKLKYVQTGGRKDNQRGDMVWVYMPYGNKVFV